MARYGPELGEQNDASGNPRRACGGGQHAETTQTKNDEDKLQMRKTLRHIPEVRDAIVLGSPVMGFQITKRRFSGDGNGKC